MRNVAYTAQRTWREYAQLAFMLIQRDIVASFRRSFLGILWIIIPPFVTMVIFSAAQLFINIPDDGVPYPVLAYTAILPWQLIASSAINILPTILKNGGILKKIALPKVLFSVVAVAGALFEFFVASVVLVLLLLYFQISVSFELLLWLPLLILMAAVLGWSLGIGFAAVGVYRRDFQNLLTYVIRIWFFVTPVVYPLSVIPEDYQLVYALNPAVGIIHGIRSVLVLGQAPNLMFLGMSAFTIVLIIAVTLPLYRMMSQYFADVL